MAGRFELMIAAMDPSHGSVTWITNNPRLDPHECSGEVQTHIPRRSSPVVNSIFQKTTLLGNWADMIEEFLEHASDDVGVDIPTTRKVSAGILVILEESMGDDELHPILKQVPGGEALLASGGGGAGGLGSLAHGLGSMFSGSVGGAAGLAGLKEELGVEGDTVSKIGEELIEFINKHAGEAAAHKIRAALPMLHQLS